jgi:hypothetical protein
MTAVAHETWSPLGVRCITNRTRGSNPTESTIRSEFAVGGARTITIPLADIDYVSVKRYALVWADLVIVPKTGTAIRLRPLGPTDAEHAESLIQRHLEKLQS